MALRLPVTTRNAMIEIIRASADAGSGPATIDLYTGSQPANADAAATGTLLCTFICSDPAFEVPVDGISQFDADPDLMATAVASGTAGWFRMKDSDGLTVMDGNIGTGASNDLQVNSTSITNGNPVLITSGNFTIPAA